MGAGEQPLGWTSSDMKASAQKASTPSPKGPKSPPAPDGLEITAAAIEQLKTSAERLVETLDAGDQEGRRIAFALNAAANAFDKVVQEQQQVFDAQMNGGSGTPASAAPVVPDLNGMEPVPMIRCFGFPASADWDFFTSWESAAQTIHSGPGADALQNFADQWRDLCGKLKTHQINFAGHTGLESGTAAEACGTAMGRLQTWWDNMGDEATRLGAEAQKLASAHRTLVGSHPTMADVENFRRTSWLNPLEKSAKWAWFQTRSETALREYANSTDLMEIRPGKPPSIGGLPAVNAGDVPSGRDPVPSVAPPTGNEPPPGSSSVPNTATPTTASPVSAKPSSSSGEQSSGSPSGESPSGGSPSGGGSPSSGGSPSGSGMPSGMPEGMPEMPGLDDPSLKPASAGAGMGGGGGGMGGGPLGPAVGAETVAASPTGARGGGVPGAAPGGGGMGGMGGGMGGMGGGHGQQGKEKRRDPKLAEDEDLYIEDRAYTEGVIGRRARRDVKDGKQ